MRIWNRPFTLVVLVGLTASCGTTARRDFLVKPALGSALAEVHRIAIVPSRIPLAADDAEFWRRANWERVAGHFRQRRIEVVSYEVSGEAFERWGVGLEDTPGVPERYASLASELGVDAIVVPYYAVNSSFSLWLLMGRARYNAVASFQVYLARDQEFVARVDASGSNQYMFGGITSVGAVVTAAGAYTVGISILALGAVVDLIQVSKSDRDRWGEAFERAISEGLEPFLVNLPSGPRRVVTPGPSTGTTVFSPQVGFEGGEINVDFELTLSRLAGTACCAAALFYDRSGNPLPASGSFAVKGQVAVTEGFTPLSDLERRSFELSLPPEALGFRGRGGIGRHDLMVRINISEGPCGTGADRVSLATSEMLPFCVMRLPVGYTQCP